MRERRKILHTSRSRRGAGPVGEGVGQEFSGRCCWIFGAGSNFSCSHEALDKATMASLGANEG